MSGTTKVKWIHSIQYKFSTILFIIITLTLTGYAAIQYKTEKKAMTVELNEFAQIITMRLSKYLSRPLWAVEKNSVDEFIVSEMMDHKIYAILVKEKDGKTLFSGMKRDDNWDVVKTDTDVTGDYISVNADIIKPQTIRNPDKIGHVEVFVTAQFIIQNINDSVLRIILTALVLNFISLVSIFITVNSILIKPIKKLTDAAEQTSKGKLDILIDISSKDEIGVLANSIDRLQLSLKIALQRLKKNKPAMKP